MKKDRIPVAATFSKDARFWTKDFEPYCFTGASTENRVIGIDGKQYLDWVSGLGANLLGYGKEFNGFSQYVNMWIRKGVSFSLPHMLEYQVAEKLTDLLSNYVPGWKTEHLQVRWVKDGSGACDAAVRLARAVTGKEVVTSSGYHGWHETFVAATPPAHGIAQNLRQAIKTFEFNKYTNLSKYEDIACVITEQGADEPNSDWYPALQWFCDNKSCLLIMDEVVTGLRYARGGACEKYNVKPDLVCIGKALGNGFPLAALVGPKRYMDWFAREDPVFVSSTNAGDVASLAAADYMLDFIQDGKYLEHIYRVGQALITELRSTGWQVIGNEPRSVIVFESDAQKAYFVARMRDHGILMNRPNFPTMAHTVDDAKLTGIAAWQVKDEWDKLSTEAIEKWQQMAPVVLFRQR